MLEKIISSIDVFRKENHGKFSQSDYFWEFLYKDLRKEFGSIPKPLTKSEIIIGGRKKNEENTAKYLKKIETEKKQVQKTEKNGTKKQISSVELTNTCTVAEAMKIIGTKNRRDVDIPSSKGLIRKVGKKGLLVLFDRESVVEYAKSLTSKKEQHKPTFPEKSIPREIEGGGKVVVEGPGGKFELEENDPNKIMNEEGDDDDEDEY